MSALLVCEWYSVRVRRVRGAQLHVGRVRRARPRKRALPFVVWSWRDVPGGREVDSGDEARAMRMEQGQRESRDWGRAAVNDPARRMIDDRLCTAVERG